MSETGSDPVLTYGQQACGVDFNPLSDPAVANLKQQFANIIDYLDLARALATPEQKRLMSIAITEVQGAQMWAVKAITYKH
jgi:hypothetical protein